MIREQLIKLLSITDSQQDLFNHFLRAFYNKRKELFVKNYKDISPNELDLIKALWELISYFQNISSNNWLNFKHTQRWLEEILDSESPTIQPFALFCPSYIKDGTPDLNVSFGDTTKTGILNFISFTKKLETILKDKVAIKPLVHIGTLALEQYPLKTKKYWLEAIENNRKQIQVEFKNRGLKFDVIATHTITTLNEKIGFEGEVNSDLINKNLNKLKSVFERNKRFYIDTMNWSEEISDERTKVSISTYNILGHYYKDNYLNPIFFYTANSYEKAIAYNLENQNLLIIYPKKDSNQNIVLI